MKTQISKAVSCAFKKEIYLLGADENGLKYWLEAPSWECNGYWGFAYVKAYTNNRQPNLSKDIVSHEHIDTSFMCDGLSKQPIHNIYDSKRLSSVTFSEAEGWELSELFRQFYLLKAFAAFACAGSAGIAEASVRKINVDSLANVSETINRTLIPNVTAVILKILTPNS